MTASIDQVLEKLEGLYRDWSISPPDWYLCEGWALRLQGYDTKKGMKELSTVVLEDKLPWKPRHGYQDKFPGLITVPPQDSKEMLDFTKFMKSMECDLRIHPVGREFFQSPKIEYKLLDGKVVYLMPVLELVDLYGWLIIKYKELGDNEWMQNKGVLGYIQDIKNNAEQKGEIQISKSCEEILKKYSKS